MDAQEFQKQLKERFIERDGMFFTASQAIEYEQKKENVLVLYLWHYSSAVKLKV